MIPGAGTSGNVDSFQGTVVAMLASLDDHHPLVTGYSGLFPAGSEELEEALARFPDADVLQELCHRGTGWVVVSEPTATALGRRLHRTMALHLRFGTDDAVVYALSCPPIQPR